MLGPLCSPLLCLSRSTFLSLLPSFPLSPPTTFLSLFFFLLFPLRWFSSRLLVTRRVDCGPEMPFCHFESHLARLSRSARRAPLLAFGSSHLPRRRLRFFSVREDTTPTRMRPAPAKPALLAHTNPARGNRPALTARRASTRIGPARPAASPAPSRRGPAPTRTRRVRPAARRARRANMPPAMAPPAASPMSPSCQAQWRWRPTASAFSSRLLCLISTVCPSR